MQPGSAHRAVKGAALDVISHTDDTTSCSGWQRGGETEGLADCGVFEQESFRFESVTDPKRKRRHGIFTHWNHNLFAAYTLRIRLHAPC